MRVKEIIEGFNRQNDASFSRTLLESVIAPEVSTAIKDWIGSTDVPGVLIGGLALSFYAKPRYTADVDVLYATDSGIPSYIPGFKKVRPHSFQHNKTHVEVEVLSPEFLGVPDGLVKQVVQTAETSNGMRIASKAGLVALKLQRAELQDQADIQALLRTGDVDLTPYKEWLTSEQINIFNQIKNSTR